MAFFELDPAVIKETSALTFINQRPVGTFPTLVETYLVPTGAIIRLRELPADDGSISVTGTSVATTGPFNSTPVAFPPSPGQYSVNFVDGTLTFHTTDATSTPVVSYKGRGSVIAVRDVNNITTPFEPFFDKLNGIVPDAGIDFTIPGTLTLTGVLKNARLDNAGEATLVLGLGASDGGTQWFNTDTGQFMGWDGSSAVVIG